jgi:outer membrane protein OmpA-like peptidoglycan-associated protein
VCSLFFSLNFCQAQDRKLNRAIEKYQYQEYLDAINLLKEIVREQEEYYTPLKYLANSYRKINDYQNAELYFTLVVNSDSSIIEDHLYYGQALKANGKLAAAKEQFLIFTEKSESSFLGKLMLQSINQIEAWEEQPSNYRVLTPIGLNTKNSEYGPLLFGSTFYITSDREEDLTSGEKFAWNNQPFLSVYEIDTADLDNPDVGFKEVGGKLNTLYHDGPMSISADGQKVIITRVDNKIGGKDFINRMKLYEGQMVNESWKKFRELPFNSDDYSVGHANYADSGKTIYFASDMPGGYGGMDIYVSQLENGRWSSPRNLGEIINTPKNEVFPYVRGNELYFSSDGFPGYGGLDIMVSVFNKSWQAPENLRSPINSLRDDFGIFFVNDTSGYLASNRIGGEGGDDIYVFIKYGDNIEITGLFEYKGLPVEGTKILLLDEKDSVVAVAYTDAQGQFKFTNLSYQENYMFKVESDDPELVDDGRLFLTDKQGEKLTLIERMKSGDFKFKALPVDEIKELEVKRAKDEVVFNELKFVGQVFEELPGDMKEEMIVYLVDDATGDILDSALTDEEGIFTFNRLPENRNYLIKVKEEDTELNVAFVNDRNRIFEIARIDSKGYATLPQPLDASKQTVKATNAGFTTLIARLESSGIPIINELIEIYDKDSNLVGTVITNAVGEFQFNQLEYDKHYIIKIPDLDGQSMDNALVYLVREDGVPLYLINKLEKGLYEFESLPFEEFEFTQKEEERLVPKYVELAGQIYNESEQETEAGKMVYLIGEDGRKLDSTKTDKDGKFVFTKLNPEENYSFQLSGGEVDDYALLLIDEQDQVIEKARLTADGMFVYKKLTYQVAQFAPLTPREADLVEQTFSHEVHGKIFKKLPGDMGAGVKVYIYDEGGDLIKTTTTDEAGNFSFTKLSQEQNYIFRIDDPTEDFTLVTLNEQGKVEETTIRKQGTEFVYSPLGFIEKKLLVDEPTDEMSMEQPRGKQDTDKSNTKPTLPVATSAEPILAFDAAGKFMIYYEYDKSDLTAEAKKKLNDFILLFAEDEFNIEIASHTDNRGSREYNYQLSKRRTNRVKNYLETHGIESGRLKGNYFGELKPLIDCDKINCTEKDHRVNRRTEIKVDN